MTRYEDGSCHGDRKAARDVDDYQAGFSIFTQFCSARLLHVHLCVSPAHKRERAGCAVVLNNNIDCFCCRAAENYSD